MDSAENKNDLYVNGERIPFTLERLLKILAIIKTNLPKVYESFELEEDAAKMEDLLNELNNL